MTPDIQKLVESLQKGFTPSKEPAQSAHLYRLARLNSTVGCSMKYFHPDTPKTDIGLSKFKVGRVHFTNSAGEGYNNINYITKKV